MEKIYKLLFIAIFLLLIISSCSKAKYTGLKSFQYSDYNKPEVTELNTDTCHEISFIQTHSKLESTLVMTMNPVYNKNKKNSLNKVSNKEKNSESENGKKSALKNNRKVKVYKPYQGPKYDRLTSTFSVNALLVWVAGFLIVGIGSVMHIFLILALALAILAVIKK